MSNRLYGCMLVNREDNSFYRFHFMRDKHYTEDKMYILKNKFNKLIAHNKKIYGKIFVVYGEGDSRRWK